MNPLTYNVKLSIVPRHQLVLVQNGTNSCLLLNLVSHSQNPNLLVKRNKVHLALLNLVSLFQSRFSLGFLLSDRDHKCSVLILQNTIVPPQNSRQLTQPCRTHSTMAYSLEETWNGFGVALLVWCHYVSYIMSYRLSLHHCFTKQILIQICLKSIL